MFLVGLIDYYTGIDARVFPLYYLPIVLGALYVSTAFGFAVVGLSTASWVAAMWLGEPGWSARIFAFNTATLLISFAVVAALVGGIRVLYLKEKELSRRDNLTSLPNSRAFYEVAEFLVAGARRSGRPFAIAYIDLDNFKAVNDERGHQEGDRALAKVAEVFRTHTRGADIVARLGGDEFAVLLQDTDTAQARSSLKRVVAALVEAMAIEGWPITASVGAVVFARPPATLDEAIRAADSVMYRVKQGGKNRVLIEAAEP